MKKSRKKKWKWTSLAIFISDNSAVMCEVLRACMNGYFKNYHTLRAVKTVLIVASNPNASSIKKALEMGFPEENIVVINPEKFGCPEAFGKKILCECGKRKVDIILSLRFKPIIPTNVIDAYQSMIFGLHAAPLDGKRPGFRGKGMYGLALQHAVLHFSKSVARFKMTEVCIHRVTEKVGCGAVVGKRLVEIWPTDTARTLAARLLPFAQNLVVEILLLLSEFGYLKELRHRTWLIHSKEKMPLKRAKAAGRRVFPNG